MSYADVETAADIIRRASEGAVSTRGSGTALHNKLPCIVLCLIF